MALIDEPLNGFGPALLVHGHCHFTSSLTRPLPRQGGGSGGMGGAETLVDGTELHLNVKTARGIVARGQGARLVG